MRSMATKTGCAGMARMMPGDAFDPALEGLRASPVRETLGITYLRIGPQGLTAEFSPGVEYANAAGMVQGGIITAFLDHLMGQSCLVHMEPDQRLATIEMATRFLAPAPLGRLVGRGWMVKKGGSVVFAEGQVHAGDKLVATGACSLAVLGTG